MIFKKMKIVLRFKEMALYDMYFIIG